MSLRWSAPTALALIAALCCPAPVGADIAPRPDRKDRDEAVEKQKVAPAVRAVVHAEEVVVCVQGLVTMSGSECPLELARAVGVAPAEEGALALPHAIRKIQAMSVAHPDDPCGENRVIEGAAWETRDLGRTLAALPPDNATYQKLVAEKVGIPDVKLTGLYKLDLEGDGTDEVIFTADSHDGERPFGDEAYDAYSFVGVRKVTSGGSVVTHLLYEHQGRVDMGQGFPDISHGELAGFTDLDGNGALEIVTIARGYESYSTFVFRLMDDKLVMLGNSGCAI